MKRHWLPAVLLIAAFGCSDALSVAATSGETGLAPRDSVAVLAGEQEPGTRLVVSGRVFDSSGTNPLPGVTLYAYHTDATGYYNVRGVRDPRLRGWVMTDDEGRFELRTIRPAPYPNRNDPAHIHIEAEGGGYPKQWVDDIQFDDDPHVTDAMREQSRAKGRFAPIVTAAPDADGVLHAKINIRLSETKR